MRSRAFAFLKPGDRINIETDMLGKFVRKQPDADSAKPAAPTLTMERLRNAGFLSAD